MSQHHATRVDSRHHISFEVKNNVVYYEEIFNYAQYGDSAEEAKHAIKICGKGSFPLSTTEPMELPMGYGGWLAVHPVTGAMRCHKHRRNARKWMERPDSDFKLC